VGFNATSVIVLLQQLSWPANHGTANRNPRAHIGALFAVSVAQW